MCLGFGDKGLRIRTIDCRTGIINYMFNGKKYKTMSWPVDLRPVGGLLNFPIASARFVPTDGPEFDVTALMKKWAGPLNDFGGHDPHVVVMQGRRRLEGRVHVMNILGHESIFAAR